MQSTIHNMMQDNTFQEDLSFHPSATSFTELAIRYNPRMSVRGARRVLHAWIRHNSDLTQELQGCQLDIDRPPADTLASQSHLSVSGRTLNSLFA